MPSKSDLYKRALAEMRRRDVDTPELEKMADEESPAMSFVERPPIKGEPSEVEVKRTPVRKRNRSAVEALGPRSPVYGGYTITPEEGPEMRREISIGTPDRQRFYDEKGKMLGFAKGGMVGSASKRADGVAQRGKTKGRMI
jgi:hypothetical protein